MLIQVNNVSVNFTEKPVLKEVSMRMTKEMRIGLIGGNGAGKSTLLKCILKEIDTQAGDVIHAEGIRVRCLTQNPELTAGNTLKQELYTVFEEINKLQAREAELLKALEDYQREDYNEVLVELGHVQENLERLDQGTMEARIGRMVTGLGFSLDELDRKVDDFSGGWQMRINLAKILLQEADILLMDEPTNHLDMEAVEWLEEFLRNYPYGIIIVSHDRRFLDQVVTHIAELDRGSLTMYTGNYSKYLEQRDLMRTNQAAAAKRQQESLKKQMEFVDRFRASAAKSTQAKSREKQLEKVEIIEAPKGDLKKMHIRFPDPKPNNREVLELKNIAMSFGETTLYEKVNAQLEWEKDAPQRVFILGANGCGKTTLFKIIMGLQEASAGEVVMGDKVELGYYAQHQLQILNPEITVLDTLVQEMPSDTPIAEIRGILGRFLFSKDDVHKKVGVISGGEKGRLALAKLMVSGPNLLLLDEPTNHMDIPAQESVEAAIEAYAGTVICISHDRHFISNQATQIWEFDHGRLICFKGGYEDYLEKRDGLIQESRAKLPQAPEEEKALKPGQQAKAEKKAQKEAEKAQKALEREIEALNKEKEELALKMSDPNLIEDYKELSKMGKEMTKLNEAIEEKENSLLQKIS